MERQARTTLCELSPCEKEGAKEGPENSLPVLGRDEGFNSVGTASPRDQTQARQHDDSSRPMHGHRLGPGGGTERQRRCDTEVAPGPGSGDSRGPRGLETPLLCLRVWSSLKRQAWKTLKNILFKDNYSDSYVIPCLLFSQYFFSNFALTSTGISVKTMPSTAHSMGYRRPQTFPNLPFTPHFTLLGFNTHLCVN